MVRELHSQGWLLVGPASVVSGCQQSKGMLNRNSFRFSLKFLKVIVWVAQGVSLKTEQNKTFKFRCEWVMYGKHQCVSALSSETQRPEGPFGACLLTWVR